MWEAEHISTWWMLLSGAPRATFSACIFQSGRPQSESNLTFREHFLDARTEKESRQSRSRIVVVVKAEDRQDVVMGDVYVGACYSHAFSPLMSTDLLLCDAWSHSSSSSTGGSLCGAGVTLGGGGRATVQASSGWLTILSFFFFCSHSISTDRCCARDRKETDKDKQ